MGARQVLFLLPALLAAQSARQDPVQWTLEIESSKVAPGGKALAKLKAAVEDGWHLYSTTTPKGPIPTTIGLAANSNAKALKLHQPKPNTQFDPNFNVNLERYEKEAVFLLEVEFGNTPGPMELTAEARYQVCSDTVCLRAKRKTASASVVVEPGAAAGETRIPDGYVAGLLAGAKAAQAPVVVTKKDEDLWQFLLLAFGFGLASVVTPCVFPMIPFTMSFFLNKQDSLRQAIVFCLGIIVLFTALGLLATAALGPFGVVQLGSSPWVNAFIAIVFLVFGLSMLGAFEITLPSGLLTRLDSASRGGGVGGTLLMGLTFSLTSFACVGPFVGTLLAASVSSGGSRPLVGMATFATGLASPFFFLALFPSYLQRLPKSGGWLPRVKVVMGFVILAAMFKYLSNIDAVLQTGFLTRDRFLAIWVVLLAMPGLYLLGLLRMEGIDAEKPMGVTRALTGAAFLVFALSLLPGMHCGRLGELDAYVPACAEEASSAWIKNDYRGAVARAKAEGKKVFINFTGYACTNCHWMKANMFSQPEIRQALASFVLVELYTDGTDAASQENQKLQEGKFQTVAIPHYVILDGDETVIASHVGLEKQAEKFLEFLKAGS